MFCSELLQFYHDRKTTFPFSKGSDSDEKVADKLSARLRANPVLQTLSGKWNHEQEEIISSREPKPVGGAIRRVGRHIGKVQISSQHNLNNS